MFVSYAPELDIAACGESVPQARQNLAEVININFVEMKKKGTLSTFLREAGFEVGDDPGETVQLEKELVGFAPREIAV